MNWHLIPYGQYPVELYFLQSLVLYRIETSVLIIIWLLVWANEHYIKTLVRGLKTIEKARYRAIEL